MVPSQSNSNPFKPEAMRPLSEQQLDLLAEKRRLLLKVRLAMATGHKEMLSDIETELQVVNAKINDAFKIKKK